MTPRYGGEWQSVEDAFTELAERVGGTHRFLTTGMDAVQKRTPEGLVTLERVFTDVGYHINVVAPFHNPDRFRFHVRDEGVMDDLWKTLGFLQDVKVGHDAFDRRFIVKGHPVERVKALVEEPVRSLLLAQPEVRLGVGSLLWYGARFPTRVEPLLMSIRSDTRDVDRLAGMFGLVEALLPRLAGDEPGWESDVPALVRRVEAPGGRAERFNTSLVVWDGNHRRRDAARRLGEIGDERGIDPLLDALEDDDDALVAAAAEALGRIGHERAAPALFALLGERSRAHEGRSLSAWAGGALEALGHGATVGAFEAALTGDPDALRASAGPYRDAIVRALMDVVESTVFGARHHAATALGALGANEALPLLRSKSTAWGMVTNLTEAAGRAVDEIEARASLPRPASGAPETPSDTHPRPAGGPGRDPGTLPRPAAGDDRD